MTNENLAASRGYTEVFENTESDVVNVDGKKWMKIAFAGKWFLVPLVNVGKPEGPTVAIAYINTDPHKNYDLAVAAKDTYRKLFEQNHSRAIFYFTSTKSEWSIDEGAFDADVSMVYKLPGGKNREEVVKNSYAGKVESYVPATGIETFVGLPQDIREIAAYLKTQGVTTIDLVDDVWSTGASLEAAEKMLQTVLPDMKIRRIVLAREADLGPEYPPDMTVKANGIADIAIPVIVGAYSKDELIPVSDKDSPQGIPVSVTLPV